MRKPYRSDLTDARWGLIEGLLPAAKPGGRPRTADPRAVVNALLSQGRTGVPWDYLPHDLAPKSTARDYFVARQQDGTCAHRVVGQLAAEKYPRLRAVCADHKYHNQALPRGLARTGAAYRIAVRSKPAGEPGFRPVESRWVVGRAHACLGRCHRLSPDYERRTSSSAAWVQRSAIRRMRRRLKPDLGHP